MIAFDRVTSVFGPSASEALVRLERGQSRDEILEQTGNLVATRDVSLSVKAGEILVLMGLSGSGKSTLLRCANALVRPVRGRVLFEDGDRTIDLADTDSKTLRRLRLHRISMVFQKFALLPWRTLRGNVAFGLEIRGLGWPETLKVVDEMLDRVGLSGWKDKCPHELSGGMQQRVGLARALSTNADLLLLDEPFSALDPLIRSRMQEELLVLQRELKKTMIFVTHDLDEALKLGSRVAVMKAGQIVQIGTPEEIVTRPATDYVRQFVAHVNPLNVLRGGSVMRPLGELGRDPGDSALVWLDPEGAVRCRLDDAGAAAESWVAECRGPVLRHEPGLTRERIPPGALFSSGPDAPIRVAIEVNDLTGRPLLIVGDDRRLMGIVSGREILRSLSSPANRPDG